MRLVPPPDPHVAATLRPGHPVTLVNVSAAGALVLTRRQMRPGHRVQLQVAVADARFVIAAVVVRCAVAALQADAVVYGGGLKFDHRVEWSW